MRLPMDVELQQGASYSETQTIADLSKCRFLPVESVPLPSTSALFLQEIFAKHVQTHREVPPAA